MVGYTEEELTALTFVDITHPEDIDMDVQLAQQVFKGEIPYFQIEKRYIKKGKEIISINLTASVIRGEDGEVLYGLGMIEDITERKRPEEELKNSTQQLRNLSEHLQSVREEERTRIAREIHDKLGQTLTALKMDLSWLEKRMPEDQKSLAEKTTSMSKLIYETIETVKRLSTELRPGLLDDLGLSAAVEWQAEEFQEHTEIQCEVTLEPEDIVLDQDRSTTLFRIFQEALTNVARHANATTVRVKLQEKAGTVVLEVKDNGKGITKEQISNPKSFGLIGIRERVLFWGGDVTIRGRRDKGTTISVIIPLYNKEDISAQVPTIPLDG